MKIKALFSLFLINIMMFGFQNCGDFSAQSYSSSHPSLLNDPSQGQDIQKLYYHYEKTENQKESYDILFDLENKKAELTLNLKEQKDKIKKSLDLSSADVKRLKDAVKNVNLDELRSADLSRDSVEEYIISYLEDQTSFLAYLETAKSEFDAYKVGLGKDNLARIINEILTEKLDNDLLDKIINLLEKRDELKSLAKSILNRLKNIKISTDHSATVSVNVSSSSWSWSTIKNYFK